MTTRAALQHAYTDVATSPVAAAPAPKVAILHRFSVSADHAWSKLGRFSAIADWQTLVACCRSEERHDGFYRVMSMRDDSVFVERLETFSHPGRYFSYSIISGPLPVNNYRSETRIIPCGDQCDLRWCAWYDVVPGTDSRQIHSDLVALFNNGLDGMRRLLADGERN